VNTVAVIDIGSNTVLVTVGRLQKKLEILLDQGEVARLSEGLSDGSPLQPEAKIRVLKTLRDFKEMAVKMGATRILAAGTAAFRRACDGKSFAKQIEEELNIPVKILTGEEEAFYSYQSAKLDFGNDHDELGMIDIGGGSTEFVFGETGPKLSLPIGTVRLTEKFVTGHPITDLEWQNIQENIQTLLKEYLSPYQKSLKTWAAVAATPASLAAVLLKLPFYQPNRVHGFHLTLKDLTSLVEVLRTSTMAQRIAMPGMHPQRAELLPTGGKILLEIMGFLKMEEVLVSDHGLRYGLLYNFETLR
jgi:exopolyphosphatase/guanosine-5'-triphosphate,3'-diphosphate pyrophosphatase